MRSTATPEFGEVPSWKTITNETVTENHTKVRKSWYFSICFDGKTWENMGKPGKTWEKWGVPSLVNTQKTMKHHHFSWENIHYFDWAIFNSYSMLNYQRVNVMRSSILSPVALIVFPLAGNDMPI